MSISPRRIEAAVSEAMQLIALLPPDDDRLKHDTLEGETRFFALLDDLAEVALADSKLVELARARIKRIEERVEQRRDIIRRMLIAAAISNIERPLFTGSTSQRQELVETETNEELPQAYIRQAPDRVLITKTLRGGSLVPGYALQDKDELVLTLRTA